MTNTVDQHNQPEAKKHREEMSRMNKVTMQNKPQLTAEIRKHCMCERCKDGVIHAACCAVHNMPAEPNGECDCEPETPAFSEDLSYYWQRILGEDWTNNQPLYELYLWVVKELATALEEQEKEYFEKINIKNKTIEHMMEEIRYLRSSQPARRKPIIRIKNGDRWYIPMITQAHDTPDGLYIEAELAILNGKDTNEK